MNPFNKNPFIKNTNSKIIGNNIQFDEKQKIEKIKENMLKIKLNNQQETIINNQTDQQNLQEKIDFLRNMEK